MYKIAPAFLSGKQERFYLIRYAVIFRKKRLSLRTGLRIRRISRTAVQIQTGRNSRTANAMPNPKSP